VNATPGLNAENWKKAFAIPVDELLFLEVTTNEIAEELMASKGKITSRRQANIIDRLLLDGKGTARSLANALGVKDGQRIKKSSRVLKILKNLKVKGLIAEQDPPQRHEEDVNWAVPSSLAEDISAEEMEAVLELERFLVLEREDTKEVRKDGEPLCYEVSSSFRNELMVVSNALRWRMYSESDLLEIADELTKIEERVRMRVKARRQLQEGSK